MKNILIPFDFSEVSQNALEYALKFSAPDPSSKLHLLHIMDGNVQKDQIQKQFQNIKKKYGSPLYPQLFLHLRIGDLTSSIVIMQEELEIDLVIMGTRGAGMDEDDLVTRTSRLVQEADLPVLVIPENFRKFRLESIILSMGQEEIADRDPLYLLLNVSRRFKARVHVLTIQKSPVKVAYSEVDESNENTLQYFLEMFYSHHSFAENEDIEKGILEYIERNDIDMLAIMPNTHLENGVASEGRLTRYLTLHTNVPLLVMD